MKIKNVLFLMLFAVAFVACAENDLYVDREENDKGITDLNIPLDFDWKTTRMVLCNIKSEQNSRIRIYNESTCADESLLAVLSVFPENDNPLRLHLPIGLKTVYIKFADDSVISAEVDESGLHCTLPTPSGRSNGIDDDCEDCNDVNIIYFPCKGKMATIMFEDYFPVEGDYDFNDLVMEYNYIIYLKPNTTEMLSMDVTMKVVAVGGLFKFNPCIRLDGLETDYVHSIAKYGDGIELTEYLDTDRDVCFRILGMTNKPLGCQFLNTDPNETIIPRSDLPSLRLDIRFQTSGDFIPKQVNLSSFNVFLDNGVNLEIHERGYTPAYTPYPDFPGCPNGETYCTKENLVWAFTIPTHMKHAKERVNFLKAYPYFEEWAISNGSRNQSWYTEGVEEYIMTIP